ncbi:MAG: hypothetical protein K2N65_05540, partial [Anaeroplasmataceae bacterium]|nr:hypothetical protein [Anaeroplasmataceae bacterium]
ILYHINQDKYKTSYTYDDKDRLKESIYTKNDEIPLIEEYQYDSLNRVIESTHPIIKNKYTYLSKNGRTTNLISTHQKRINGGYQRHSYQYDKEGNIINKLENHASTRYTYDSLNRLIREDNEELNQTVLYTYDGNGNIQTKEIYDYTLTDNLENKTIIEYNYNDFNDYLTRFDGKDIRYDSLGNPIVYKDIPLVWNQKELKKYGNIEFTYNGNHIRTKKNTNGKSIEYIVDGSRILKEKIEYYTTHLESILDEGGTIGTYQEEIEYIYGNQGIIGFDYIKGNMKTRYYYNKNILGDILEIYDEYGRLVGKYSYDAYGNHKILIDIDHIATLNPFRYRSYYYDEEIKLYYLNSRYYDS